MSTRWKVGALVIALLVTIGIVAAANWGGPDSRWTRHDRVDVVRVVDGGGENSSAGTVETVVVAPGRGFVPFGLFFIPFVVLLGILLLRLAGPGRGRWDSRDDGQPPPWLDEWHRRQHDGEPGPEDTSQRAK